MKRKRTFSDVMQIQVEIKNEMKYENLCAKRGEKQNRQSGY